MTTSFKINIETGIIDYQFNGETYRFDLMKVYNWLAPTLAQAKESGRDHFEIVSEIMADRMGMKEATYTQAWRFYDVVVEAGNDQKKRISEANTRIVESLTGTESTQADGQPTKKKRGRKISSVASPNIT